MSKTVSQSVGWIPEEMMKVKSVGKVQVSPDKHHVVFTVTEAVMTQDKSEYLTHIYMTDTAGSDVFPFNLGDKPCTNPQWSPNGEWIAFTLSWSGKNNLYLISPDGDNAQQLTDVKAGVDSFKWSPDGEWIAFVTPDAPKESEEKAEKGKNDARIVDENFKMNRLWVIPVKKDAREKREARLLTNGDFNISSCFGRSSFDWSPDGKTIAFSHTPTPRVDDWSLADISVVDVATDKIRRLVSTDAAERSPLYSPNGCWIAYQASDNPPTWSSTFDLFVMPAGGGQPCLLAKSSERWPDLIGWSADSKQIYFTDTRGTITGLFAVPLDGSLPRQLDRGDLVISSVSLDPSNSMVGFVAQTTTCSPEAYVAQLDRFAPLQVSRSNSDLPDYPFGHTEIIRYRSYDGLEVEGLLTYPVGYEHGKRYPLLLIVHGGPMGMFTQTYVANLDSDDPYPVAAFAAQGYVVLRCNIRGSSGYGKKFIQLNYRDWGGGDYEDLMAGVDYIIQMGVADGTRLGVMGWSYGGYMTAWILTQTKRFKAASVGAGAVNLISSTGTTSIPTGITDYFGTEFWDDLDIYLTRSPIFHIKDVSTPTLIQHFEQDDVVLISQGYEHYHALKRQGVPVRMVVYPRTPHGLKEPKLLLDYAKRNVEWFDQYLKR